MKFLRQVFLLLLISFYAQNSIAEEGMWIPTLIEQQILPDMQSKGLTLSAEDIYSVNQACLKDAVVIFGGGCTGEFISDKGIVLTNHHCGFRAIQSLSTVENDYLTHGFWAKNSSEELPVDDLKVRVLKYMDDVSAVVLKDVQNSLSEKERSKLIETRIDSIKENIENDFTEARVVPFYNGNQYFLFVNSIYKDVRLVGTPPDAIGGFGGDIDNWVWPRHGGDFSVFRVYADSNNSPTNYTAENKPFKPKYVLPISTKGIKEDDFTMVLGYPGSTNEYATSYELDMLVNHTYPERIDIRTEKLDIIYAAMESSPELNIKYAAKAASISNSWKRWKGEIKGLKRFDVVHKKQDFENQLQNWIEKSDKHEEYSSLLLEYQQTIKELTRYKKAYNLIYELIFRNGMETAIFSSKFSPIKVLLNDSTQNAFKTVARKHFRDFDLQTDVQLTQALIQFYKTHSDPEFIPESVLNKDYDEKRVKKTLSKSMFTDSTKLFKYLDKSIRKAAKKVKKDPAFKLYTSFKEVYYNNIEPNYTALSNKRDSLQRIFMKLQQEYASEDIFPDANFTFRLTYGKVKGYEAKDAVSYSHATTLNGIIEKHDPNIKDYTVPEKLLSLHAKQNFGNYEVDGSVPVCFVATNHTTGGNSGSPVLNKNGELIGLNFDRAWDGVMSDLYYSPVICRNVSVDIRYVLFIIEKYGNAKWLINEMNIVE